MLSRLSRHGEPHRHGELVHNQGDESSKIGFFSYFLGLLRKGSCLLLCRFCGPFRPAQCSRRVVGHTLCRVVVTGLGHGANYLSSFKDRVVGCCHRLFDGCYRHAKVVLSASLALCKAQHSLHTFVVGRTSLPHRHTTTQQRNNATTPIERLNEPTTFQAAQGTHSTPPQLQAFTAEN
jgi:hypothetical protein